MSDEYRSGYRASGHYADKCRQQPPAEQPEPLKCMCAKTVVYADKLINGRWCKVKLVGQDAGCPVCVPTIAPLVSQQRIG